MDVSNRSRQQDVNGKNRNHVEENSQDHQQGERSEEEHQAMNDHNSSMDQHPEEEDEDDDDGTEEEELQIAVYRIPETHKVRLVKVVPLPHARSEIWSYFGFVADDSGEIQDRKKVICKLCATTLSYSGNTTNLFTHLKSMHPEANPQKMPPTNKTPWKGRRLRKRCSFQASSSQEGNGTQIVEATDSQCGEETRLKEANNRTTVIASKSSSPVSSLVSITGQPTKSCSFDDITNAIVDMIVKDFRPVSLVEGAGFQDLLKLIAPSYQIPDSSQLTILAEKRYEELKGGPRNGLK